MGFVVLLRCQYSNIQRRRCDDWYTMNWKICALLGYYTASNGNPLPTFRDNVLVPSSTVKKSKKKGVIFYVIFTVHFLFYRVLECTFVGIRLYTRA